MKTIENQTFGGERPLFASHGLKLVNVTITPGESALKCCSDIEADHCRFQGKYPFWHVTDFTVNDCLFQSGARAALWYSSGLTMKRTLVEAPKMFREMDGVDLEDVTLADAQETLWHCRNVKLRDVTVNNGDYLLMHSSDIDIDNYRHQGNYSFQYCRNVVIRNAVIDSKDAFWGTEDVTVYDSTLTGEYLGWHSRRLRLVNCRISGTQPLCYATDLVMENCTMDADADLAFEESTLHATIASPIASVKNPTSGTIECERIGELILDANIKAPADCRLIEHN